MKKAIISGIIATIIGGLVVYSLTGKESTNIVTTSGNKNNVITASNSSIINNTYLKNENKETIKNISSDFFKASRLLPINVALSDCLDGRDAKNNEEIMTNFSRCISKLKQDFKDPLWFIEKNMATFKKYYTISNNDEIAILLKGIQFNIDEMHNNQLILYTWKVRDCGKKIDLHFDKKIKDVKTNCLVLTNDKEINYTTEDSEIEVLDALSQREVDISKKKISYFTSGSQITIDSWVIEKNNFHYKEMIENMDRLTEILRAIKIKE